MGLRQKSRGIRFGFPEYITVALVGLTLVSGVGWWRVSPKSTWITVPASVVAVSLVEGTHGVAGARPLMRIHFDYLAGGHAYQGAARFDRVSRVLYGVLPEQIRELLIAKGYLSFKDLPDEIQVLLRKKGISSFDQVTAGVLEALKSRGYNSVEDLPEEAKRLLVAGEFAQAAEAAGFSDETVSALTAASRVESVQPSSGQAAPASSASAQVLSEVSWLSDGQPDAASLGTILHVRYDPHNPMRHEIDRFPYLYALLNIGVFLAIAAMTLFYCGVIYPRFKQR